jgi:hypothetical protein
MDLDGKRFSCKNAAQTQLNKYKETIETIMKNILNNTISTFNNSIAAAINYHS